MYLGLDILGLVLVVVGLAAEAELLEERLLGVLVYRQTLLLFQIQRLLSGARLFVYYLMN